MKAVVLYGPHNVSVGELPVPELLSGYIKVKVAYCGLCGSDLHKVAGKKNTHPVKYPVALGHEMSGVVAEVGEGVTEFKVGDRVTVDPNWSCGKCKYCKAGKPSFCEHGRGVVKGMAEYVVSPEENVYHIPDSLPLRSAALAEPVACCLRGMDLLNIRSGESVALIGFGAIGAIMLQLIRNAGAGEIAVIEYNEERRELAKKLGADYFFASNDTEAIEKYASEHVIDKVIECVGKSAAHETALNVAGRGATVVMFGVADSAGKTDVSFYDAFSKELTIKTSFVNPHTTERAVRLLASGRLDVDNIFSAELTMEEMVDEVLAPKHCRRGKVLCCVDPTLEK